MRDISSLVRSQFPKYIREGDHEKFIAFVQAYYDFLNEEGNPNDIIGTFNDLNDIGKTIEPFIKKFVESFAFALPPRFFTNKKDAVKHLKEVHSIKGTPESYKLLFRLLYDEVIDFYFPEIDILRPSAQQWDRRSMLAIQTANPFNIVGNYIQSKNFSAEVIDQVQVSRDLSIYWIEFDPDTATGFIIEGEDTSFGVLGQNTFAANATQAISAIRIVSEGSGYVAGTVFTVNDGFNQADVLIERVGPNGELTDLRITTQNYRGNPSTTTDIPPPPSGIQASVELMLTTMFIQNRPPAESFNQPSGRSRIQDRYFYSPYTYVIKSGQSISLWRDMIYRMLHPAGMGLFSQILILSTFKAGASGASSQSSSAQNTVSIYNWQVVDGILQFFQALDLLLTTHVTIGIQSPGDVSASFVGRDVRYFEQNKFLVPPYTAGLAGTANVYRDQWQLEGYEEPITKDPQDPQVHDVIDAYHIPGTWNHKNFRIDTIEHMTIEMFVEPTKYKTNFQPGSFIRFTDVI